MKRRLIYGVLAGAGMLVLILDSQTALQGATEAITMCIATVIPSLFPFFVLSNLLTDSLIGVQSPWLRPLGRFLGVPQGTEGIFITGLLGGYPTGAQAAHRAWKNGSISQTDAVRMLSFCSNAGPAFLFGIVSRKFPDKWMVWLLWGIHIVSAVAVAVVVPHAREDMTSSCRCRKPVSLTGAVKSSITVCGWVCGWIVFFRVMIFFCQRWFLWLFPEAVQVAFYGLLELMGGCCALDNVENLGLRFVMASGMVSFGGICVAMQTASVTGTLGMRNYWKGKFEQCCISAWGAYFVQRFLFPAGMRLIVPNVSIIAGALLLVFTIFMSRKRQKESSIPAVVGV